MYDVIMMHEPYLSLIHGMNDYFVHLNYKITQIKLRTSNS